jgi:hypothetical protein
VLVKGTLPYDEVLAKIKKTGKEVCRAIPYVNLRILLIVLQQVRSGTTLV